MGKIGKKAAVGGRFMIDWVADEWAIGSG